MRDLQIKPALPAVHPAATQNDIEYNCSVLDQSIQMMDFSAGTFMH
jgi:hypothetical protein